MLHMQEFTFFREFLVEFQALATATLNQSNTRYTLLQPREEPKQKIKSHSTTVPTSTAEPTTSSAQADPQVSAHTTQQYQKKDKPKSKSNQKTQSNSSNTTTTKKYPAPPSIQCTQCPDQHTHILQCAVFQKADPSARLKQTQKMKIL